MNAVAAFMESSTYRGCKGDPQAEFQILRRVKRLFAGIGKKNFIQPKKAIEFRGISIAR